MTLCSNRLSTWINKKAGESLCMPPRKYSSICLWCWGIFYVIFENVLRAWCFEKCLVQTNNKTINFCINICFGASSTAFIELLFSWWAISNQEYFVMSFSVISCIKWIYWVLVCGCSGRSMFVTDWMHVLTDGC